MNQIEKKPSGVFLRIVLPLLVLVVAVSAGAYFLVFNGEASGQTISKAGDIAAIYLIFLIATPMFIFIAVLTFLIAVNIKTHQQLSTFLPGLSSKVDQVNKKIRSASTATAGPIIEIDAYLNAISRCFSKKDRNGK